jgi:hypothetical protein
MICARWLAKSGSLADENPLGAQPDKVLEGRFNLARSAHWCLQPE